MTKQQATEIMPFIPADAAMPAHLKNSNSLGNEQVSQNDIALPRLNVLQQLSPQVDESKSEFIDTAKPGLLHNSVTNEVYESVYVVNLYYTTNYALFTKRAFGKGFFGTYDTEKQALDYIAAEGLTADQLDIVKTGNHYCLLLDAKGEPITPILLSLSSTKLKVSNNWNADIHMAGGDRFASVWELSTVRQSNAKGSWYNLHVDRKGWAAKDLYNSAKENYEALTASLVENKA